MRNLSTKNKEGGATKEVPKDSSASTSTGKDSSSGNSKFIWWGLPIATIIPVIYYALNGNEVILRSFTFVNFYVSFISIYVFYRIFIKFK